MPGKTDDIKRLVEERLAELDQERAQLLKALSALGETASPGRSRSSVGSTRGESSPRRPGRRRRKGGTRAEHAEKAVAGHPGITASQIAEELKIKPNYVYRVMADLVKEDRVVKKGTGYYPPAAESPDTAEAVAAE